MYSGAQGQKNETGKNANDFCEQLFFSLSVEVPWCCCSWIVVISVKSQVKEFRSAPLFHPSLFHRMTLSPFFLLPLLPNLQSVDLNWKMTWFSSAASSLLHKNQHASSREIWGICYCLSPPLSLSLFLSFRLCLTIFLCVVFFYLFTKGQSSASRLCCQKPLFTKGRNKWLTQTASFIPA